MTRDEILAAARQCVSEDRAATYGDAHSNFANIASLWQAYLDGLGGIRYLKKWSRFWRGIKTTYKKARLFRPGQVGREMNRPIMT